MEVFSRKSTRILMYIARLRQVIDIIPPFEEHEGSTSSIKSCKWVPLGLVMCVVCCVLVRASETSSFSV